MKFFLCLFGIIIITKSVICEDEFYNGFKIMKFHDSDSPDDPNYVKLLDSDYLDDPHYVDFSSDYYPVEMNVKEYSADISPFEEKTFEIGGDVKENEPNALPGVDYPKMDNTMMFFYDNLELEYNQIINDNKNENELEGKNINNNDDDNNNNDNNNNDNINNNDINKNSDIKDNNMDLIFVPESVTKTLSNAPKESETDIMKFFDKLKSNMADVKIIEIKSDSFIYVISSENLKQMQNTYYSKLEDEYLEPRKSTRGAILVVGVMLMALGCLFVIFIIKLRSRNNKIRANMTLYEPMKNEAA